MFRFVLLSLTATFAVSFGQVEIIGGYDADIGQYPYQVSIRDAGWHECGGIIYKSNIIITAAHCLKDEDITNKTINAGSTFLNQNGQVLPILKYKIHENYDTKNDDFDVAVVLLKGNLEFGPSVQPILLATSRPPTGTQVALTGWGRLSADGARPNTLQQVKIQIVDQGECKKKYPIRLTDRMICVGDPNGGKDACRGDSGGPLALGFQLVGIVSWGIDCGLKGWPGVYASVPDQRDWIIRTAASISQ